MLNLLFLVYFLRITLFNLNISHEIAKPTQSKYYFATTRAVVLKTILPTLKKHVLRQHLMVDIKPFDVTSSSVSGSSQQRFLPRYFTENVIPTDMILPTRFIG